ncbi:MAG TPA: NAD(P)-dependent oxidoreductase [Gemmatimonadales bacterium]|nr:NAD(P)-dependent oxidoreductase [Gemmatimonadales bacterium]
MNVAFLGLGAIGTPMAVHVAARHSLAVWNRTGAKADAFAESTGATVARTPREAAAGAEVVVTCLATSADLEGLLDGPDGLLAGLSQGALLLDCTSGDPAASRRIAERLAEKDIGFVDAPVSGGVNGAEAATLTVMAGGTAEALKRGQPVLECFAKRIELMGPVGTGHAMKAVNNALLAVNILAVGEGLAALVASGIPAARAVAVLNASSGRSFVSEALVPERVLTGTFPLTFRLALLDKDTGIALDVAESAGVEAPVLELGKDLLATARAALGEEADYLEPIRLIESAAGIEIRG